VGRVGRPGWLADYLAIYAAAVSRSWCLTIQNEADVVRLRSPTVTVCDETPVPGRRTRCPAAPVPGMSRHGGHDSVIVNIALGFRSASSNRSISIMSDVRHS
jgi:hypothetical protein